jgi:MFS family permease
LIANIGLALQKNYAALLVLRMIQSSGSSGTIALSIAVVADVATSAQRGKYTGFATAGILLGPAFGPTIGGALAQFLGWRSIFWFLTIFSAIFLMLFIFVFPETCRNVVGNGSIPARGINQSVLGYLHERKIHKSNTDVAETIPKKTRRLQLPNPWLTLRILGDKESALLLIYNALAFSGQMVITAALPSMLAKTYGYNEFKIGLCFLPVGSGALAASILTGYLMDWNFRRHAKLIGMSISNGKQQDLRDFPLERARVEVIWPYHILTIIFMITFGWVMQYGTNIAGPEILLFCLGFVVTGAFNVSNAFLVDLHRESPATATAAVNLTRCLASAGGVALIVPLINAIGRGWAFTMIGFLDILLTPSLWALTKWGPRWRMEKYEKERKRLETETLPEGVRTSYDASTESKQSEKSAIEEV